ncbi:Nibrin [Tolypocladium ophioglossoides CBS 100239]|uniref:Nibrin n=1 Tax=Tolypocladium ophioglossoides (strain CBS 100239) TaxID=1163406 RepID=A0A0L0NAW7_TOLOC|nr:Nibrin [Tolypocladium ophioglossoides CBS 100239]
MNLLADNFTGRRLWLRPGKTYLFGRTAAEPGQLAISHNTISRKHLTITVDRVEESHAYHLTSRSKLTIEDLATKIGTVINGQKIKGSKYVVDGKEAEMTMGKCPSTFRITWFPVVFTFSFTKKELQTQPLMSLQEQFENLDIKLLNDYSVDFTTHVVSKKRNTAKGLQALINGRYVVTESFLDAVILAAEPPSDGDTTDPCHLEQDFTKYWPDAMQHLPPRGGEPVQHPDSIYTPDPERKDVFDGYTFIFYDTTQYNNLLAPISNGCGKAMLHTITPGEEQVDDFVRYVKEVAGEKGLGSFDDGSEGKGVVLVRYLPAKGDLVSWYTEFITAVSLRLDHRPIEQNEFLEAILVKDASKLRRPLEVEFSAPSQDTRPATQPVSNSGPQSSSNENEAAQADPQPVDEIEQQSAPRRGRPRRLVKRRFAGFDDEADMDIDDPLPAKPARPDNTAEEEGGLFVSQGPDTSQYQPAASGSPRKRRASPLPEDNLMDGMAPAAARFKRQRLERGEAFASPSPEPAPAPTKAPSKKKAKEIDVLAMAARHREEAEARARAEKEDLANLPDDVDLAEIRRLNIVEEMPVRDPAGASSRTREQEIADPRWDPRWNGVKNFKKFRRRGEPAGRQPARVIVPLAQVKNKEFGVGDNYWLEDEGSQRKNQPPASHRSLQGTANPTPPVPSSRKRNMGFVVEDSGEEAENNSTVPTAESALAGTHSTRISATPSQRNTRSQASRHTSQSQGKRPAPESASDQRAKRPRPAPQRTEVVASDDSDDDELKFRFGRRR